MRCADCSCENAPGIRICANCGVDLTDASHRRMKFLSEVIAEARSWPSRGVATGDIASSIIQALEAEHDGLSTAIRELNLPAFKAVPTVPVDSQKPGPKAAIPMAILVSPPPAEAPARPEPREAPAPDAPAPPPPPVEPSAPAAPAEPAEPRPPWYLLERNLRWIANLGILVFNVGLIGFITTSWGGWRPGTKLSVLAAYSVLLFGGGLLLRLKTRMNITGLALLVLALASVPIAFYTAHYYRMTGLSAGAIGSLGAAVSLAAALLLAAATGETLFHWLVYPAATALVCFLFETAGVRREAWGSPLIGLAGLFLAGAWLRRRAGARLRAFANALLGPANVVAVIVWGLALFGHLALWLFTGRLEAAREPFTVIAPLALGCGFGVALAVLEESGVALLVAAALKPAILAAALRAAGVPTDAWPPWMMALAVLAGTAASVLWPRMKGRWLWPHLSVAWSLGGLAALMAAGSYFNHILQLTGPSPELDRLILTLAMPLAAAAGFVVASRRIEPALTAGLLGLAETGLVLARQSAELHSIPVTLLSVAAIYALAGSVCVRYRRQMPGQALTIMADIAVGIGLLCLLQKAGRFWPCSEAVWAAAFLGGAGALYAVEAALRRGNAAYAAMAGFFGSVPFLARWAGMEWPAVGACLAAVALALPLGCTHSRTFARPAVIFGHIAAAVALVMAGFTYALRDDMTSWALAAIACASALHLWSAVAYRQGVCEYTGLALGTAAWLLLFREFDWPNHRYCLLAAAVPVAFHGLSLLARRLRWSVFTASAPDVAAAATVLACGLAALWSIERPNLWYAVATAAVLAAVYVALAFIGSPREWLRPEVAAVTGSAMLAATDAFLLVKMEIAWHALPVAILGLAVACFALGVLAGRFGRPGSGPAFAVFSDLAAAAGLIAMLFDAPMFWETAHAPWAAGFLLGAAGLYTVEALLKRRDTAYAAVIGLLAAVPFAARSAGLEWPVAGAWLAAASLLLPLLVRRLKLFSQPALIVSHAAAAVALVMACCVYGLRGDMTCWGLAAIGCVAALHLWTAVAEKLLWFEYTGLPLIAAAYLLVFREFHLAMGKYCLAAAAIPAAFYALSFLASRRGWHAFAGSAFAMAAPGALATLIFAGVWSLARPYLWYSIIATAALAAVYLALSFVEAPRKWLLPPVSAFVGSALLASSYLLVLHKYSTGTPYRSLWIFGLAPVLSGFGLWLRRSEKSRQQGASAIAVSVLVSLLALWQALVFPDRPLVATLAFAAAAALYSVLAAMLRSAWFGAAASTAFSVAYFSLLRQLHVPAHNYVLWLAALGMLQALLGGAGDARARERRPAMFVGMATAAGVISWMVMHGELYLDRSGPGLDTAILTTLASAAIFALVAWLRRSQAALYPAAAAALGSYYLVLHRFEISAVEFYTVPVALLALTWERLAIRPRWGRLPGDFTAGTALVLLLLPSLILSWQVENIDHALAALGLSCAAVVAGMYMRRRVHLAAGTLAFVVEAVGIKLVHFIRRHHISHWVWLLLAGLAILGFVIYAETRRNRKLRAATGEYLRKVAGMFEGWE